MRWLPIETVLPPSVDPVPLDMLRDWCRVSEGEDDAKLYALGMAAVRHVEQTPGGLRLMSQTVRLRTSAFGDMVLPVHPVQSVSVAYIDAEGVLQTLDPGTYDTLLFGIAPRIRLATGASWPAIYTSPEAVQIAAVVGWPDINGVPEDVRLALQLLVCHWFDNPAAGDSPEAVDILLAPYRQPQGF